MGAIGGLSTSTPQGLSTPLSVVVPIAVANIEQLHAFPPMTKYFRVFNDGNYVAKLSYQAGESNTNYVPIYPGDDLKVYGIIAASVTLYIQSPGLTDLCIESWT